MAKNRFRKVKQGKIEPVKSLKTKLEKKIKFVNKKDYFKAFLTDTFMLLMPILYFVIYFIFGSREGFRDNMLIGWLYILIPLSIVEILFLAFSGQTPGMRAYNIKLIDLKTLNKPFLYKIILRQILAKISFLSFFWIVIFINKQTRNLHDFIVGSALIYAEPKK